MSGRCAATSLQDSTCTPTPPRCSKRCRTEKQKDSEMKQSVAIVTGASRGIGRATAIRLARDFSAVVVVGRSAETLQDTASEVQAGGAEPLALALDLSILARRKREPSSRRTARRVKATSGFSSARSPKQSAMAGGFGLSRERGSRPAARASESAGCSSTGTRATGLSAALIAVHRFGQRPTSGSLRDLASAPSPRTSRPRMRLSRAKLIS
jgi:NAD(P)-dependent dehydrogenase (short-subunit alcohol dehydrogenase family)